MTQHKAKGQQALNGRRKRALDYWKNELQSVQKKEFKTPEAAEQKKKYIATQITILETKVTGT